MKPRYLRGLSLTGYGVSLSVGVGIPIPILNEEMAAFTGVSNEDILMPVKDYGYDYPNGLPRVIQHVRFSDLLSGEVETRPQNPDRASDQPCDFSKSPTRSRRGSKRASSF